jgi:hypothetical protein
MVGFSHLRASSSRRPDDVCDCSVGVDRVVLALRWMRRNIRPVLSLRFPAKWRNDLRPFEQEHNKLPESSQGCSRQCSLSPINLDGYTQNSQLPRLRRNRQGRLEKSHAWSWPRRPECSIQTRCSLYWRTLLSVIESVLPFSLILVFINPVLFFDPFFWFQHLKRPSANVSMPCSRICGQDRKWSWRHKFSIAATTTCRMQNLRLSEQHFVFE